MAENTGKYKKSSLTRLFTNEKWGKGTLISPNLESAITIPKGAMLVLSKARKKENGQWIDKLTKNGDNYYYLDVFENNQEQSQTASSPESKKQDTNTQFADWI